jgi:Protein of unknown function (DUF3987)
MTVEELLAAHGIRLGNMAPGRHYVVCPRCSHQRQAGHQAIKCLGILIDDRGVCWHCNHCDWRGPEKGAGDGANAGNGQAALTTYEYRDELGTVRFRKVRNRPGREPKFWLEQPDGRGGWTKGTQGINIKLLYRLPEINEAIASEYEIAVVEGEKDVDNLWRIGVPATCNVGGASRPGDRPKWYPEHSEQLRGALIVVLNDNDPPGQAHAEAVCRMSLGVAARVRRLDLAQHWPGMPAGKDVSDWLELGHTREELDALFAGAPEVTAAAPSQPGAQADPVFNPWERYIVPTFPFDVLPSVARDYVAAQSAIIGCDGSALAMAMLGAFAGALDHRFQLKMMRHGSWYERARLWVMLVGDVSQRKTPIFRATTRPLYQHETELRKRYEAELKEHDEAAAAARGVVASKQKGPPAPPRYVVHDTTVEKLGDLLARSPKGLLVKCDEGSGWLGAMERYSNNAGRSDRAFWLQAFDGGSYTVDRIKRGELFIENLSVSLLVGIQPERLAELKGLTSDGLVQRFLPVMMTSARFTEDRMSDDEEYAKLVRTMIAAKPARLIMTDDALATMTALRQRLFDLEQISSSQATGFQSFVGKLHGLTGSLALILHLAHDPHNAAAEPVDEYTVDNVRKLVLEFILPHAFEFYRGAGDVTDGDRLRVLASWVLTSGKQRFVASDFTTNVWDCRGLTLPQVNERVSPLVAAGWLEPADNTPVCRSWKITGQVHIALAEQAKREAARKAALAAMFASLKRQT